MKPRKEKAEQQNRQQVLTQLIDWLSRKAMFRTLNGEMYYSSTEVMAAIQQYIERGEINEQE